MSSRLFLYNTTLLSLETSDDPRLNPTFPLSKSQYDALTADGLMQLLRDEVHVDPMLDQHQPKILRMIGSLLLMRCGVNCVKVHWDGYGVSSRHGTLPEATLAPLHDLFQHGKLSDKIVDEMVWASLKVA